MFSNCKLSHRSVLLAALLLVAFFATARLTKSVFTFPLWRSTTTERNRPPYLTDVQMNPTPPLSFPKLTIRSLPDVLQEYEKVVNRLSPEIANRLKPGVSNREIKDMEKAFRLHISNEVQQLYQWRNGESGDVGTSHLNTFPHGDFLSLRKSLERREHFMKGPDSAGVPVQNMFEKMLGYRKHWIGVLLDPSGSGYYADCNIESGHGNFIYSEREDLRHFCHPSIAAYVEMLLEADRNSMLESTEFGIELSDEWYSPEGVRLKEKFGAFWETE